MTVVLLSCGDNGTEDRSTKQRSDALWMPQPEMNFSRAGHTATVLNGGTKVLVVGGFNGGTSVERVEIFDVTTKTWSVKSDSSKRHNHAAQLLPDGRVLVAGGERTVSGVTTLLDDTEIYDPASDTWAPGPTLSQPRTELEAVLSPSGTDVYLIGGRVESVGSCPSSPCYSSSDTVEIIDIYYTTVSVGPSLPTSVFGHRAVITSSGKLLVAGGIHKPTGTGSSTYLSDVSILDFSSSPLTWSGAGSMTTPRAYFALLETARNSGLFLATGGRNPTALTSSEVYKESGDYWFTSGSMATARSSAFSAYTQAGNILVVGGNVGAELWNPSTGVWSVTTPNLVGLYIPTSLVLLSNGMNLAVGGYEFSGSIIASNNAQLFSSRRWVPNAASAPDRVGNQLTDLGTGVVVDTGGQSVGGYSSLTQSFDTGSGAWTTLSSMTTARAYHMATPLPSGRLLVVGGLASAGGGGLSSAEIYDPITNLWTGAAALPTTKCEGVAYLLSTGAVLVSGGTTGPSCGTPTTTSYLYNESTNTWSATGNANGAGHSSKESVKHSNGKIYAFGTLYTNLIETYTPATGTWTTLAPLIQDRLDASYIEMPDGRILVAGGDDGLSYLSSTEFYTVAGSGSASSGPAMSTARWRCGLAVVAGAVLVVGGGTGTYPYPVPTDTTEFLDTSSASWLPAEQLSSPAMGFLTNHSGETVLIVGGGSAQHYRPD